ncbi:MAG: nucleotidyltransferase domain-containing protein [Anaerolineaceae bacterium]|nr:nucleotidyltransferase domain-containing protein [Anaerolineaceae bacterium]
MASQIAPSQMERYRQTAREREEILRVQLEVRKQRAWIVARQAAHILKEEFGASRVVVFGSLLHAGRFHHSSDVDLAVWGIQHYFRAVSWLLDIDPEIKVDLVPVEDARPGIVETIQQEGVDL